ncbi:MAG TPA: DUF423 domain-containing protein [Bacillota bacterium]|nr:DUF423 domain-containing protein [Bacillota bacterium]
MRLFLVIGAASGFIAVALGAFGAHGLEGKISEASISIWEKAVQYQMFHTFALVAVGLVFAKIERPSLGWSGWLFLIGIILFSGSLYTYALTGVTFFALITPFGGVAFLIGWFLLGFAVVKYL